MSYIINPKEVYLLEQFSSLKFFEVMRNNYRLFLDGLEELFGIYMHNLPYNLRDLPFPEQADIQWGGTVLPNLRATMDRVDYAYAKIKSGDFTYLDCAGEIRSNDKGISEFSPHWMDDLPSDKVKQCWNYYSVTRQYAFIIENTYPTSWDTNFLIDKYPSAEIFNNIKVKLPASYPIYRINPEFTIKSKLKLIRTGIYICNDYDSKLVFLASSNEEDNGFAPRYAKQDLHTGENIYYETTWTLIERIAGEGGTGSSINTDKVKILAGQNCPQSGYWWSPAHQSEKRYFEQGEVFPEILKNAWGKTIWYLEVTNKK